MPKRSYRKTDTTPSTSNTTPTTPAHAVPDEPQIAPGDPLLVAPPAVAMIAMASSGFTPTVTPWSEAEARRAMKQLEPRLWSIPRGRITVARVDLEVSAGVALATHAFATQVPGLARWFSALHAAGLFDRQNLDDLRSVACVLLHAVRNTTAAEAVVSTGKLTPELDRESARVEREMQGVCEHNFLDDPVYGPKLEQLRPGTSYADRASDLLGYAEIYEAEHATISKDTKWKPTHVEDARRLAGEIYVVLGIRNSTALEREHDVLYRAWTLLWKIYEEVQVTGQWLLRFDPQGASKFPSLISASRTRPGTKGKQAAEEPAAAADGAGDAAGADKPADAKPSDASAHDAKPGATKANGAGANGATAQPSAGSGPAPAE